MSSHVPSPMEFRGTASETVVGVDVGVKNLLVAAPATASADVEDALVVDGEEKRELFNDLVLASRRVPRAAETAVLQHYRKQLLDGMADAIARFLAYLEATAADAVALEDLGYERKPLSECREGDIDASAWILPEFLARLEDVLVAEGYRVEFVSPKYTSQICHHCEELGSLRETTLKCTTSGCPVSSVDRDRSAAVSIATRASYE